MPQKRIIGYTRISPRRFDTGLSLALQAEKIRAQCSVDGYDLVEIVEDDNLSGKDIDGRPGFQRALQSVLAGKADGLMIWRLDRAFRNTKDTLEIAEKLNTKGKALISISEKIDTKSAIGEFFFTLLASIAQLERRMISDRTKAALAQKKAGGFVAGKTPFGYKAGQSGELIINPDEQKIIARVHALRYEGLSTRHIAEVLTEEGFRSRAGTPFIQPQVHRMLKMNVALITDATKD